MKKSWNIGLFGYGVAAQGFEQALRARNNQLGSIRCACVRNPDKARPETDFRLTTDPFDIWNDDQINVIVELIDDAEAAFDIVCTALKRGIPVISGNKKMIATHFKVLKELQALYDTPLLYEAACAASIPIIRCLEDYYVSDDIRQIEGVVNGSTNYILGKVSQGESYASALTEAQEVGFAEADPSLDVDGYDAVFKLCLLSAHGFGQVCKPSDIPRYGISEVRKEDFQFARQKGKELKLLVKAEQRDEGLLLWAGPALANNWYEEVRNEFNALEIESAHLGVQRLSGKGAGALPTGQATLADLQSLDAGRWYSYARLHNAKKSKLYKGSVNVCLRFSRQFPVKLDVFNRIDSQETIKEWVYVEGEIDIKTIEDNGIGRSDGQLLLYSQRA